jgi:hypothetical protein
MVHSVWCTQCCEPWELEAIDLTALIVWSRAGLDGDLKKAMKDGKPVIIEVCPFVVGIQLLANLLNILLNN